MYFVGTILRYVFSDYVFFPKIFTRILASVEDNLYNNLREVVL